MNTENRRSERKKRKKSFRLFAQRSFFFLHQRVVSEMVKYIFIFFIVILRQDAFPVFFSLHFSPFFLNFNFAIRYQGVFIHKQTDKQRKKKWTKERTNERVLISTVLPHNYFDEDELDVSVSSTLTSLRSRLWWKMSEKMFSHWHEEIDDDG